MARKTPVLPAAVTPASRRLQRRRERLGWLLAALLGLIAASLSPLLFGYLGLQTSGLFASGKASKLCGWNWFPQEGLYGLVPLIAGTLSISLLALGLAVPLGLCAAISVRFHFRGRWQRLAEAVLAVASGMPSVVFGLFGTFWLLPRLGPSLAAGSLVLAGMCLPTFAVLALAALRQLPEGLLRDGYALGMSREQCIVRLALPSARHALTAAASLTLARCLGETLAVEMVCGNVAAFPRSLGSPVRTLTTTLVQEFEYAVGAHSRALHAAALCVVCLTALVAAMAAQTDKGGARP